LADDEVYEHRLLPVPRTGRRDRDRHRGLIRSESRRGWRSA
jgi:hypothetical protein